MQNSIQIPSWYRYCPRCGWRFSFKEFRTSKYCRKCGLPVGKSSYGYTVAPQKRRRSKRQRPARQPNRQNCSAGPRAPRKAKPVPLELLPNPTQSNPVGSQEISRDKPGSLQQRIVTAAKRHPEIAGVVAGVGAMGAGLGLTAAGTAATTMGTVGMFGAVGTGVVAFCRGDSNLLKGCFKVFCYSSLLVMAGAAMALVGKLLTIGGAAVTAVSAMAGTVKVARKISQKQQVTFRRSSVPLGLKAESQTCTVFKAPALTDACII